MAESRNESDFFRAASAAALVLVVVLALQNHALRNQLASTNRGTAARAGMWIPAFERSTLQGRNVAIGNPREDFQFIYVFMPGCPYCKASNASVMQLATELKSYATVGVVGISESDEAAANKYARQESLDFDIATVTDQRLMGLMHSEIVPVVMLVDRRGRIVYSHSGTVSPGDSFEDVRKGILAYAREDKGNEKS